jgi:hypothetical protein
MQPVDGLLQLSDTSDQLVEAALDRRQLFLV